MRKSVLALLLACVCVPAVAQQEVQVPDLDQPTGVCADCPDPGEGGGGGGTPPPPPAPTGQPSVTNSYSSDPSEGALEFVLKYTGQPQITFVVDRSTGRLYMNNGYALFEAPLSTLAADAYPNNPAAQQDFLARLQGNLNNFFEVSQGTVTGTSGSGLMWDGSGPQRRPCDNWGCYYVVESWYNTGVARPVYDGGGWSATAIQTDYQIWYARKQQSCQSKTHLKLTYASALGATFAACMSLRSPSAGTWAKTACGAGIVGTLVLRDQLVDANRECAQDYPGPMRW